MIKKIGITFIILMIAQTTFAQNIRAVSLEKFSTNEPKPHYKAQIIDPCVFKDGTILYEGSVIEGSVVKIQHAKRGKRNGYFDIEINSITTAGITQKITKPKLYARVVGYAILSPQELVLTAARTAAGIAVKGASQGISFAQGFIEANDGSRIKSAVINVYKDSPLSYIETGKELNINEGDTMILKVKELKEKNKSK